MRLGDVSKNGQIYNRPRARKNFKRLVYKVIGKKYQQGWRPKYKAYARAIRKPSGNMHKFVKNRRYRK